MKKVIPVVALFIAIGVCVFVFRAISSSDSPLEGASWQQAQEVAAPTKAQASANNGATSESGTDDRRATEIATDVGYRAYAEGLALLVYRRDPVAIERLVDLNGACHTASAIPVGAKINADMSRLKEYCEGYSGAQKHANYWPASFTARMEQSLTVARDERGNQAVSQELGRLVDEGGAYEARAALQYSAKYGVTPDILHSEIDQRIVGSPAAKEQLDMLAQLEFCRRGGDCGSNDFSTLAACAVIGPCRRGESLISLFRRKTTPDGYESALRISQRLAGND